MLTNRYLMTWMTGNGGRIDHDDSEDDRFGINPIITGYATGTPYHLDMLFSIRDRLRDVTRNINWDALWAGFITQVVFGYFDFGQASLLYNHQWFMDVDTALKAARPLPVARGPADVLGRGLRGLVRRDRELADELRPLGPGAARRGRPGHRDDGRDPGADRRRHPARRGQGGHAATSSAGSSTTSWRRRSVSP